MNWRNLSALTVTSFFRSSGWSEELEGGRPDHQHSDSPLGSSGGQRPKLQGLIRSSTRRRRANGMETFYIHRDVPRLFLTFDLMVIPDIQVPASCQQPLKVGIQLQLCSLILTVIRSSCYCADGGFNILLNRRRCQEAPPPPSWGTWMPTLSTTWLLFPSTRTWRAYGRMRRERQVSESLETFSSHSWSRMCIVPQRFK